MLLWLLDHLKYGSCSWGNGLLCFTQIPRYCAGQYSFRFKTFCLLHLAFPTLMRSNQNAPLQPISPQWSHHLPSFLNQNLSLILTPYPYIISGSPEPLLDSVGFYQFQLLPFWGQGIFHASPEQLNDLIIDYHSVTIQDSSSRLLYS